jgi:hypothetical protein
MFNARNCEGERRVKTLFASQTADEMLLESEQRAPLIKLFKSLGEKDGDSTIYSIY